MKTWPLTMVLGLMFLLIAAISRKRGFWWFDEPTRFKRSVLVVVGAGFVLAGAIWKI